MDYYKSKSNYPQYCSKVSELNCLLNGTSGRNSLHSSAASSVHSIPKMSKITHVLISTFEQPKKCTPKQEGFSTYNDNYFRIQSHCHVVRILNMVE